MTLTKAQITALRTLAQAGLFRASQFRDIKHGTIMALLAKGALDKYGIQYRVSQAGYDAIA